MKFIFLYVLLIWAFTIGNAEESREGDPCGEPGDCEHDKLYCLSETCVAKRQLNQECVANGTCWEESFECKRNDSKPISDTHPGYCTSNEEFENLGKECTEDAEDDNCESDSGNLYCNQKSKKCDYKLALNDECHRNESCVDGAYCKVDDKGSRKGKCSILYKEERKNKTCTEKLQNFCETYYGPIKLAINKSVESPAQARTAIRILAIGCKNYTNDQELQDDTCVDNFGQSLIENTKNISQNQCTMYLNIVCGQQTFLRGILKPNTSEEEKQEVRKPLKDLCGKALSRKELTANTTTTTDTTDKLNATKNPAIKCIGRVKNLCSLYDRNASIAANETRNTTSKSFMGNGFLTALCNDHVKNNANTSNVHQCFTDFSGAVNENAKYISEEQCELAVGFACIAGKDEMKNYISNSNKSETEKKRSYKVIGEVCLEQ